MNDLKYSSIKLGANAQLFRVPPQLPGPIPWKSPPKLIRMSHKDNPLASDQVNLTKIYAPNNFQGSVRVFHPDQDLQIDYGIQKEG